MIRERPEPEDETDRRLMSKIDQHGWAILHVGAGRSPDEPSFSYTAGIWETLDKPELLLFNLQFDLAAAIINNYANRSKSERFVPGARYSGFLKVFDVVFVEVDYRRACGEHTRWTDWYYRRQGFPLLQLMWPANGNGTFPWDQDFPKDFLSAQPVLGSLPH